MQASRVKVQIAKVTEGGVLELLVASKTLLRFLAS